MASTRLATDDGGRPVLVKEGEPAALAREAAVLAAARHPGVVEVATSTPGRLVLRWIGTRTLADYHPPVGEAVSLAAALAATVADLHASGIRHGRIVPGRVVLDSRGRPVLCGFAGAALADEDGPTPADDVAGVGTVIRSLAGADAELEPIPEQRFVRPRNWSGALRRALLTVADQATADDPARRPTARSLAGTLADLVPDPSGSPAHAAPPRRRQRVAVAALGIAAIIVIATLSGGARAPAAPVRPATATAPVAEGDELRMVECEPVEGLAADVDGDGCPSPVVLGPGTVEVDGVRYGVGEAGDVIAVADWDCDGVGTVAVLRPSTGEVFVFERWADDTGELVVPPVTVVPGASDVRAGDVDGDGCPTLVVSDANGNDTEVAP